LFIAFNFQKYTQSSPDTQQHNVFQQGPVRAG
jgi:hypothetical protein